MKVKVSSRFTRGRREDTLGRHCFMINTVNEKNAQTAVILELKAFKKDLLSRAEINNLK